MPLFEDLTTLQLREFMLDSEVLAPAKGELIFKKDDYTNTFFSIVDGEVVIEVPDNDGKFRQRAARARGSSSASWGCSPGAAAPARCAPARTAC